MKRWVRSDDRLHFMDSLYRLIQLSTELSSWCLSYFSFASLEIWPHDIVLLAPYSCVVTKMFKLSLSVFGQWNKSRQSKCTELNNNENQKPKKSQVYQIDSPIRFQ